jgi:Aerotolerance regulator N-terminal/CARDB
MNFLFPTFLWSLLAVAIPIAIHLFNFRRTRRIYFSNVALLKNVEQETSSFRRLKQWLILAARVLAVAALALAFAQPYLPSKNKLGIDRAGVTSIYLDNSFSMQNEDNNQRYLDIATQKLDQLLGLFKNATNIQLITNDFASQEQQLSASTKIKDRLTTIKLAHTPRSLETVFQRQQNLLSRHSGGGKNQLFWFSDFQKSTVGDLAKLRIDSNSRLFVVPVQAKTTQNVFVDSVWLNTPFVREFQNNIIFVKVSNAGTNDVKNLVIKLFIDNTQVSTAPVNLSANGSATASFNFNIRGKGYKQGRITFDDFPITFDNDYFFVLNASPIIRVSHLYSQQSPQQYIQNVFDNDSLFALQSFNVNNADLGILKTTDLIVLEGIDKIEGALRSEVDAFVKKGGTMLLIPPASPDVALYSGFLSSLGINGLVSRANQPPNVVPLSNPDRASTFFADVFEQSVRNENVEMPNVSPVWQWQANGSRILSLRSGDVFLSQSAAQKGKVFVLANPLQDLYGNFGQNALFVPTMYKIAALSAKQERAAYSFAENTITLTVKNAAANTTFKLKKDKLEIIPVQRLNGEQLTLELPKSNQLNADQEIEAGYYELQANNQNQQLLAINQDNRESKLDFYSPTELRKAFSSQPNIQVFDNVADGDFVKSFEKENVGLSLWKYFLYAALAFLLIETLIIRFVK